MNKKTVLFLGGIVLVLGITLAASQVVGTWYLLPHRVDFWDWLPNDGRAVLLGIGGSLGTNLVAAVVFLVGLQLVIDRRRSAESDSARRVENLELICARLRSGVSGAAAVTDLRVYGFLNSGELRGKSLQGCAVQGGDFSNGACAEVDFSSADLRWSKWVGANLQKSKFHDCNLTGADFSFSDLTGAYLTVDQMKECGSLWNATLPDGSRYDGRWQLPLEEARAADLGLSLNNPADRIEFYGQ